MSTSLRIGLSACFFHPDANRAAFGPKTLQYVEQSMARWVMSEAAMPFLIASPHDGAPITLADYARELDALILQGGSDVCPETYGEKAMKPQWNGDRIRDLYEIDLLREFMAAGKPVLGVCRGAQLINVAFGGTLYQDIATQRPDALNHRDAARYDENFHAINIVPGSGLAQLYPGVRESTINTVHHQAAKDLGRELAVEAWSQPDRIVESLRWQGDGYVFGVQWHPEFQDPARADLLDTKPLLRDFLARAQALKERAPKVAHA
jgi:putative glutamine amidotransferase